MTYAARTQQYVNQPADVRSLSESERDELIISMNIVDGEPIVLSRYGDDTWLAPSRITNLRVSSTSLRFLMLPKEFRAVSKAVMYRFSRRGLDGRKPPVQSRQVTALANFKPFLQHLCHLGIHRLSDTTPLACSTYVQAARERRTRGKLNKPSGLMQLFLAVEVLYELSQFTDDPMACHPWPDSSASHLAGLTGAGRELNRGGNTPLIPDSIFCKLFQYAWNIVEHADELLDLSDEIHRVGRTHAGKHDATIWKYKKDRLQLAGFTGALDSFNGKVIEIRTACYVVIASLSGCRNHEIAFIQTGACKKEIDRDGNVIWWLHSKSTKTGAGNTRWMVPEAVVKAVKVMERWARPHQKAVTEEIQLRRTKNPKDPEIAEALLHSNALFLSTARDKVRRTVALTTWNFRLKKFASDVGVDWNLATHHFRRKFANYAARSRFGDLRYLREHFKHWSLDMTLAYAMNGLMEVDLFMEINSELDDLKEQTVSNWLTSDTPLSGGYGRNLAIWRGTKPITLFRDHAHMVRSIARSTALRSNGQAFCTADDSMCVGNRLERTRCSDCSNAVIDDRHAAVYQGLYDHLGEVLNCDDIGEGGRARIRRDLDRCQAVMTDLGFKPAEKNAPNAT
ncbi:hypothetical protein [Acidovorax sp. SDU_ACID1]|uniref:hypothetical protein n=1 Tax=Acidovorax sp. SDU_ACID1 TaxID=3136632 RepID=UPI003873A3E2